MNYIELDNLEIQVDYLLRTMEKLQTENKDLRYQLARHVREKNQWYQNNRQMAGKIKKIINHLQESLV